MKDDQANKATAIPPGSDNHRRTFLKSAGAGVVAGLAASVTVRAQDPTPGGPQITAESFAETHEPRPLAFDAGSLDGLSRGLIESHWSNNYGGSVRALNETKRRLAAALDDSDLPAYLYNNLKREHLMRTGSVVLHELYFDNLGGNGRADGDLRALIASGFGDFDRWETEFRRIAAGLGGGAGWVILGYNRQFGTLENYWQADHTNNPPATEALLVLDMYEHSYHMDYGAEAARYIDAFFDNINWEAVLARIEAIR